MTISNIVLEVLKKVVEVLEGEGVDYCLFGGLALQVYRRIRATKDIDVMVAVGGEGVLGVIGQMERAGFQYDRHKGAVKIRGSELYRLVYQEQDYGLEVFVDLMTAGTPFPREALRRKRRLALFGIQVNVASCEDLILLKLLAERPLDLADARGLIEENLAELDQRYLQDRAQQLGVDQQLQHLLKER